MVATGRIAGAAQINPSYSPDGPHTRFIGSTTVFPHRHLYPLIRFFKPHSHEQRIRTDHLTPSATIGRIGAA